MKEILVELIKASFQAQYEKRGLISAYDTADDLIANGVMVTIKREKLPTDLSGKCGSCAFAKAELDKNGKDYYVRCTNPEHIAKYFRSKDKSLRQRTNPACRQYKPKEGACNG
jgi:hypothetical protein